MHETTLAHKVASLAADRAREVGSGKVKAIHVRLAAWAEVEPDELRHDFGHESSGGPAEGAELRIELVEPRCRCKDCGTPFEPEGFGLKCQSCGSARLVAEQPDELEIVSIEC